MARENCEAVTSCNLTDNLGLRATLRATLNVKWSFVVEKLVDLVAPQSRVDLLFKATLLVAFFTVVDFIVGYFTHDFTAGNQPATILVTFMVGAPFGLFVMAVMSVQRQLKERLKILSQTDGLTDLPNRSTFFERATKVLNDNQNCAILMIDVDNFKQVNDTYGHYAGDVALMQIGRHLQKSLRTGDVVGRIGGEEFAVVLEGGCSGTLDRITNQLCDTIHIDSTRGSNSDFESFSVTLSIGGVIALKGQSLVDLMKFADEALYEAKAAGRNCVVFHGLEGTALKCHQTG